MYELQHTVQSNALKINSQKLCLSVAHLIRSFRVWIVCSLCSHRLCFVAPLIVRSKRLYDSPSTDASALLSIDFCNCLWCVRCVMLAAAFESSLFIFIFFIFVYIVSVSQLVLCECAHVPHCRPAECARPHRCVRVIVRVWNVYIDRRPHICILNIPYLYANCIWANANEQHTEERTKRAIRMTKSTCCPCVWCVCVCLATNCIFMNENITIFFVNYLRTSLPTLFCKKMYKNYDGKIQNLKMYSYVLYSARCEHIIIVQKQIITAYTDTWAKTAGVLRIYIHLSHSHSHIRTLRWWQLVLPTSHNKIVKQKRSFILIWCVPFTLHSQLAASWLSMFIFQSVRRNIPTKSVASQWALIKFKRTPAAASNSSRLKVSSGVNSIRFK